MRTGVLPSLPEREQRDFGFATAQGNRTTPPSQPVGEVCRQSVNRCLVPVVVGLVGVVRMVVLVVLVIRTVRVLVSMRVIVWVAVHHVSVLVLVVVGMSVLVFVVHIPLLSQ